MLIFEIIFLFTQDISGMVWSFDFFRDDFILHSIACGDAMGFHRSLVADGWYVFLLLII